MTRGQAGHGNTPSKGVFIVCEVRETCVLTVCGGSRGQGTFRTVMASLPAVPAGNLRNGTFGSGNRCGMGGEHRFSGRCAEARVFVDEAPDNAGEGAVGVGERFKRDGERAESGG